MRATPYAWQIGLLVFSVLLFAAIVIQGPRKALGQFFGLGGLFRLFANAVARLRNAGRLLAVVFGAAVLSWTGFEISTFRDSAGLDDLNLIRTTRGLGWDVIWDHAILAGLSPLRDLIATADFLPLEIGLAIILAHKLLERSANAHLVHDPDRRPGFIAFWFWAALVVRILYQMVSAAMEPTRLPWGGFTPLEIVVVPAFVIASDAVVVSWILVELRNARLRKSDAFPFDFEGWIKLLPRAVLVCVLLSPGRYLGFVLVLAKDHYPGLVGGSRLVWILIAAQATGVLFCGLVGAAAWSAGGSLGLRNLSRAFRDEGGRLTAWVLLMGVLAVVGSAPSYALVLSMPSQGWLLTVADAYAHYATLALGLLAAAGLVEIGERALPQARLVERFQTVGAAFRATAKV